MRRQIIAICIGCMMVLTFLLAPLVAFAEPGQVTVRVEYGPAKLRAAGNVALKITVENDTALTLTNVRVQDSLGKISKVKMDDIAPDTQAVFGPMVYAIPENKIGKSLGFTVSWQKGGATNFRTASITVGRMLDTPMISLTRTVTPEKHEADKPVTFTYTITNMSSVVLYDVLLSDSAIGFSKKIGQLNAMQATEPISVEKVLSDTVVSVPTVSFHDTTKTYTETLSALEVSVLKPAMTIVLTPSKTNPKKGEKIQIAYQMTNTGNVPLKNVQVFSALQTENATPIYTKEQLLAGETFTFSKEETIHNIQNFKVYVTAIDGAELAYRQESETLTIVPDIPLDYMTANFDISMNPAEIFTPSKVTLTVKVKNTSAIPLYDVKLTESQVLQSKGTLWDVAVLQPNEEMTYQLEKDLIRTELYRFAITCRDEAGYAKTIPAADFSAFVGKQGQENVQPTPTSAIDNGEGGMAINLPEFKQAVPYLLWGLGILLILSAAAIGVIVLMQGKQEKKK